MKSALSVMHVCAPAPFGGLERVVAALSGGLAHRGHRVMIAAILDPDATIPAAIAEAADHGVEIEPLRLPRRAYGAERGAVGGLARAFGAEFLHTHGYRSDVVAGPLAGRLGAARVSTVHGFTGGGLRNRVYEWLQKRALRRCDAVVAVSDELARTLRDAGIERVRTVANGAPLGRAAASAVEARRELGVDEDAFHVGWVGRLSAEKGPDTFLEALAELRPALPFVASILGDGPMRQALEARAARLGLLGRVRFAGPVESAARLFRAFDVFVLSSRREGTPISLLEAIAAGTPVVATRVGGIADAAGPHGALYVDPMDAAGLGAAIREVRSDPAAAARRALSARAHRDAGPDWIDAYQNVYEAVGTAPGRNAEPAR